MLVQKDFSVLNFWRFSGLILLFSVEAVALTVAFRSLVKIVDAILMLLIPQEVGQCLEQSWKLSLGLILVSKLADALKY